MTKFMIRHNLLVANSTLIAKGLLLRVWSNGENWFFGTESFNEYGFGSGQTLGSGSYASVIEAAATAFGQ
jgi:hypothetical protein